MNQKDQSKNLQSIYDLLENLNMKYKIHYHGEEGDYSYLKDNDLCITIENPYNNNSLYIDYVNEEITISYYKWHSHYPSYSITDYVLPDIQKILTNQKCLIIINSGKRWLSSTISDEPLDANYNYQKNINFLPKEFVQEIKELGGTIELYYWHPQNSITINIKSES